MHGIKTTFLTEGSRPIASLSTAVIGIVGTAPDAPTRLPAQGAADHRCGQGAGHDRQDRHPAALAAIADQASPVIVLVRVGVDAQDQDT
jgi:phage tail sheath protein FI